MARINVIIPDDLHDKLRLKKVTEKKELPELITWYLRKGMGK